MTYNVIAVQNLALGTLPLKTTTSGDIVVFILFMHAVWLDKTKTLWYNVEKGDHRCI